MELSEIMPLLLFYLLAVGLFYLIYLKFKYAFCINYIVIAILFIPIFLLANNSDHFIQKGLLYGLPLMLINTVLYVFMFREEEITEHPSKHTLKLSLEQGNLSIGNLERGVSIIGSAGSGKTESVVYSILKHLAAHNFSGVIHDYKDFEITEMAYPLFKKQIPKFYVISFDKIFNQVNPIAPRYMVDEESVNEISRVLIENLMEQRETGSMGSSKFFNDAAEGLISGMIWKLKTSFPEYCTLPHLIAIYQFLNTDSLISFLESNTTSKAMASAFISGKESDRQTAGVKSTLANALKKISTHRIFMALAADGVPLDINNAEHPAVVSIVNNPKFESSYSPVIAALIHTIIKQMSVRNRSSSFLLMEEAPTIRLLNMHRIPATLRSYNITTVYVMQDKVQNDLMYGEKASRAILSNLSYQFFGKVNDPDTAEYYERFFEIIKRETISVNKGYNLNFDTRVTTGEREVAKIRANTFFKLKQGEFIAFADGQEQSIKFKVPHLKRELPELSKVFTQQEMELNFEQIHTEVQMIFKK